MFLINILDIFKNLILFRYLILAFCLLGLFLIVRKLGMNK